MAEEKTHAGAEYSGKAGSRFTTSWFCLPVSFQYSTVRLDIRGVSLHSAGLSRHILVALALLLAASLATAQGNLQKMLSKPLQTESAQDIAPPDPQKLSADWWQYFATNDDQLESRVEQTRDRMDQLARELVQQGRDSLLPIVDQIETAFSAYLDLRRQEAPSPAVLPEIPGLVDLHTFLNLDQRLRDLRREATTLSHYLENVQETIKLGKQELDADRIAYLAQSGSNRDTLESGLQLMRNRLRVELAREDLRRRKASETMHREEMARLTPLVEDAAKRLVVTSEDAGSFLKRAEISRQREAELDSELARMGLERDYGTPDSAADIANRRLQQITRAEVEVRRARSQTEAALYATAAGLLGDPERPDAGAAALRQLLEEARSVARSIEPHLSAWQEFLQHERQDTVRELGTAEGTSGSPGNINRTVLQVADTVSEELAGLARSIADLKRVIGVAADRLVHLEGLLQGTLAEIRAIATQAMAALGGWFTTSLIDVGETPVTPLGLLRVVIIIAAALLISRLIRRALDRMRRRREVVSQAALYTLSRISHYLVLIIGTLIALSSIGIDFTKFALFATALGVGIGFGLQTLISNFVAGIIILFERSLKVGDFVELESGVQGEVKEISIRSTLVNTNDNVDIVVPNAELISKHVVNWTMQAPHRRIHLPFPIAFGTDRDLVRHAGLEAALEVPFTMNDTSYKPQVWLVGFEEDRMQFELVVWLTPNAVKRPSAVSAAYYWALADALDRHGINLPFPQRDLHLKSYYGLTGKDAVNADRPEKDPSAL